MGQEKKQRCLKPVTKQLSTACQLNAERMNIKSSLNYIPKRKGVIVTSYETLDRELQWTIRVLQGL